jgi:linoleoyl-CoA desaturase
MESSKVKFEIKLREKVSALFEKKGIKKYADNRIFFKALFFILLFIFSYSFIIRFDNIVILIVSYSVLGLTNIFLSINIGHEAIHNCLSSNKKLNKIGKLTFNLSGVSSLIWGAKHLNSHHKHTNIPELDTDFQQSKLVRLDPNFPKSKFHYYQQYYIPIFYLLYTFHWTYLKDFKEAISLNIKSESVNKVSPIVILVLNKFSYLILFLLIPLFVHSFNFNVVLGFLFSYIVTGAFFGLFLIPIHINDYAQIQNKTLHNRLTFIEQLESTPNFSTTNRVLNFLLGGFNHHACHHLFPSISHVHYPQITRLVQEVCNDEGIRYNNLTYSQLIKSHFRHLKNLAKQP